MHHLWTGNDAYAMLSHQPVAKGHTLVIPKKHCRDLLTIKPQALCSLMQDSARIGRKLQRALKAGGMTTAISSGYGQQVHHIHVHLIPRWKEDGLRGFMRIKISSREMGRMHQKLRWSLSRKV